MILLKTSSKISFCQRICLFRRTKFLDNVPKLDFSLIIRRFLTTNKETLSIDMEELDKFRRLSSKWWEGDQFLSLRNMNQLRVPFIVDAFQTKLNGNVTQTTNGRFPLENIKLLDIGCGGGILSESLARLGANTTGIDPIKESIDVAKNHAKMSFVDTKTHLNYQCCTIEEFSLHSNNQNSFDAAIVSEVLEHVEDISSFLQSTISCIRPGGFLVITTINQTLSSYIGAIFLAEYIFGFLPKGTHEYSKFIPPAAMNLILEDYNCDVLKTHGMFFNPITFKWHWIQDQSVSYAMLAVKR